MQLMLQKGKGTAGAALPTTGSLGSQGCRCVMDTERGAKVTTSDILTMCWQDTSPLAARSWFPVTVSECLSTSLLFRTLLSVTQGCRHFGEAVKPNVDWNLTERQVGGQHNLLVSLPPNQGGFCLLWKSQTARRWWSPRKRRFLTFPDLRFSSQSTKDTKRKVSEADAVKLTWECF